MDSFRSFVGNLCINSSVISYRSSSGNASKTSFGNSSKDTFGNYFECYSKNSPKVLPCGFLQVFQGILSGIAKEVFISFFFQKYFQIRPCELFQKFFLSFFLVFSQRFIGKFLQEIFQKLLCKFSRKILRELFWKYLHPNLLCRDSPSSSSRISSKVQLDFFNKIWTSSQKFFSLKIHQEISRKFFR